MTSAKSGTDPETDQLLKLLTENTLRYGDVDSNTNLKPSRKIRYYDFKRPDIYTRDNIRAVQIIFERFARKVTSRWSADFKVPFRIYVSSVDQITTDEFLRSVSSPGFYSAVTFGAWGRVLMSLDAGIYNTLLSLIFGGTVQADYGIHSSVPVSYYESVSLQMAIKHLVPDFLESFYSSNIFLGKVTAKYPISAETDPHAVEISNSRSTGCLIELGVGINDSTESHYFHVFIPESFMRYIKKDLVTERSVFSKSWSSIDLRDFSTPISVVLLAYVCPLSNVLGWFTVGNVIPSGKPRTLNRTGAVVSVNHLPIWHGDYDFTLHRVSLGRRMSEDEVLVFKGVDMEEKLDPGALADVPVTLTVELGRTSRKVKDILTYTEGTIVELDRNAGEPVDILINGKLVGKGEVVVIDESFGVRIVEVFNPPAGGDVNVSQENGK